MSPSANIAPVSSGFIGDEVTKSLGKGVTLVALLSDMLKCPFKLSVKNLLIADKWLTIKPPPNRYQEVRKALLCLELCQSVATAEELKKLRDFDPLTGDLNATHVIVSDIQVRAFAKMWRLEGYDEESALEQNRGSNARKATFLALGKRLTAYKKTVMKAADTLVPLCDRPVDAPPPAGASSKVASSKSALDPSRPVPQISTSAKNKEMAGFQSKAKGTSLSRYYSKKKTGASEGAEGAEGAAAGGGDEETDDAPEPEEDTEIDENGNELHHA